MRVNSAFDDFDSELNLDPRERKRAIKRHHELRDLLQDAGVTVGAILQGSFARKTMLKPLRDVDMIVFLHDDHSDFKERSTGPDEAMGLLEKGIGNEFPDATFTRGTYALKIEFDDVDFTVDLVPGFDTDSKLIEIANRDTGEFEISDTRLQIEAIRKRNGDCEGRFVRQVRMAKHYLRQHTEDIPGFAMECIAYAVIHKDVPHSEGCGTIFREGVTLIDGGELTVPGTDENFLERLDASEFADLRQLLSDAADKSGEAIKLEADGDDHAAINVWRDLFGDAFPEAPAKSEEEAFVASVAGGVSSSGYVTSSAAAKLTAPPARAFGGCRE